MINSLSKKLISLSLIKSIVILGLPVEGYSAELKTNYLATQPELHRAPESHKLRVGLTMSLLSLYIAWQQNGGAFPAGSHRTYELPEPLSVALAGARGDSVLSFMEHAVFKPVGNVGFSVSTPDVELIVTPQADGIESDDQWGPFRPIKGHPGIYIHVRHLGLEEKEEHAPKQEIDKVEIAQMEPFALLLRAAFTGPDRERARQELKRRLWGGDLSVRELLKKHAAIEGGGSDESALMSEAKALLDSLESQGDGVEIGAGDFDDRVTRAMVSVEGAGRIIADVLLARQAEVVRWNGTSTLISLLNLHGVVVLHRLLQDRLGVSFLNGITEKKRLGQLTFNDMIDALWTSESDQSTYLSSREAARDWMHRTLRDVLYIQAMQFTDGWQVEGETLRVPLNMPLGFVFDENGLEEVARRASSLFGAELDLRNAPDSEKRRGAWTNAVASLWSDEAGVDDVLARVIEAEISPVTKDDSLSNALSTFDSLARSIHRYEGLDIDQVAGVLKEDPTFDVSEATTFQLLDQLVRDPSKLVDSYEHIWKEWGELIPRLRDPLVVFYVLNQLTLSSEFVETRRRIWEEGEELTQRLGDQSNPVFRFEIEEILRWPTTTGRLRVFAQQVLRARTRGITFDELSVELAEEGYGAGAGFFGIGTKMPAIPEPTNLLDETEMEGGVTIQAPTWREGSKQTAASQGVSERDLSVQYAEDGRGAGEGPALDFYGRPISLKPVELPVKGPSVWRHKGTFDGISQLTEWLYQARRVGLGEVQLEGGAPVFVLESQGGETYFSMTLGEIVPGQSADEVRGVWSVDNIEDRDISRVSLSIGSRVGVQQIVDTLAQSTASPQQVRDYFAPYASRILDTLLAETAGDGVLADISQELRFADTERLGDGVRTAISQGRGDGLNSVGMARFIQQAIRETGVVPETLVVQAVGPQSIATVGDGLRKNGVSGFHLVALAESPAHEKNLSSFPGTVIQLARILSNGIVSRLQSERVLAKELGITGPIRFLNVFDSGWLRYGDPSDPSTMSREGFLARINAAHQYLATVAADTADTHEVIAAVALVLAFQA